MDDMSTYEKLISFKTAKLAKEKGFDNVQCSTCYCVGYSTLKENKKFKGSSRKTVGNQHHLALAPTQSLLQRWLREKHNIHISITQNETTHYVVGVHRLSDEHEFEKAFVNVYEEALEVGLLEALKLIK